MAGRPAHEPTDQQRSQVEAMAGYGIPHHDMARIIGITHKTLEKHYRDELDTGSAKATAKVAETLYRQAVNGNTGAAIFWLKARAGWREKQQVEHTGAGGEPINLKVEFV